MGDTETNADRYPLPRTFEEFNEQRRASFIRVKDFKQAGGRLVGYLCSYTPLEIIDAAGASGVALCCTSDEVIPAAEVTLPANLCPLIKSTYGFASSEKCPFTFFSDIIVGETTCDGKKKMYELLDELKPTHILHLPQGRDRAYERDAWYAECRLLKERLEELYGIAITDDDLRAAVRRRNRMRRAMTALYNLQAAEPPAMSGVELMSTMFAATFSFDVEEFTTKLEALAAERRAQYEAGERPVPADAKRLLVTGCPIGGVINKIGRTIERNGGEPDRRGGAGHPACHLRPLSRYQLLRHDAECRSYGQYAQDGREVRRRWRDRKRAYGLPHLQCRGFAHGARHRGGGCSVHEDRDRLQCRRSGSDRHAYRRVHRDTVRVVAVRRSESLSDAARGKAVRAD